LGRTYKIIYGRTDKNGQPMIEGYNVNTNHTGSSAALARSLPNQRLTSSTLITTALLSVHRADDRPQIAIL
jgi:hypothetical protein